MTWGKTELEPEVRDWLLDLPEEEFGHVAFYIDLLQEQGVLLDDPYTASGAAPATASLASVESSS